MSTLDEFDKEKVVRFLTAVGDVARLEIIILLSKRGQLNVGQIAGHFELSRPAISHHLKVLKTAGVVQSKKEGQEVFYWLDRDAVAAELRYLAELVESKLSYPQYHDASTEHRHKEHSV
jgi:ArsR family transcriptional regulator, arsenate/arsenite/antimonite-responsive transcriptional repressor